MRNEKEEYEVTWIEILTLLGSRVINANVSGMMAR